MLNRRVDPTKNCDAAGDTAGAHRPDARFHRAPDNAFARGSGVAVFVCIALLLFYASFGGTNSWLTGAVCSVFGLSVLWTWIAWRRPNVSAPEAEYRDDTGTAHGAHAWPIDAAVGVAPDQVEDIHDDRWALLESAEHLRELLDAQDALIVKCTSSGIITFVNQAFCRATGRTREQVMGHRFQPTLVRDDGATFQGELPYASRGVTMQTLVLSRSHRIISWEVHALSTNGGAPETQLVGHDVTDQVQRAKRLQGAREEAEAGNRAKSRFLAAMSHEIRTPLNGILGLTSLLRETSLDPEQKAYCESISQSGHNLLGLINEILDFSKIEAGKISLCEEPFSLEMCAQNAVELLAPRAHEKDLELAWTIDPEIGTQLVGDAARVEQILLNLISNAIKFTDAGGVSVYGALSQCGHNIEVVVADTGIGLSPRECETLFQEFEQTEAAIRRQSGGTGLGLAIGRKLARAMGGDIKVASELGSGTRFTFSMPFVAIAGAFHGNSDEALASGDGWLAGTTRAARRRVAIVSDRSIERNAMLRVLRAHDAEVVCCGFMDAVATLSKLSIEVHDFDAVIFDAGVCVELVEEVLNILPEKRRRAAFVCVDASERAKLPALLAAGCRRHLVRPVRPASLLREVFATAGEFEGRGPDTKDAHLAGDCVGSAIREHREPARTPDAIDLPQTGEERTAGSDGEPRLAILLAEDNAVNQLIARRVIENAGHRVSVVRNGAGAVQYMRGAIRGEADMPDLILMDIMMPHMDGVEATQAIKALCRSDDGREAFAAGERAARNARMCPPIIALTANAYVGDRAAYLEQGLDDYLSKPFEADQLTALIERWREGGSCAVRVGGTRLP